MYSSWFSHALYFCPFKIFHILKLPGAPSLFAWEWTNKLLLLLKKTPLFPTLNRNDVFVKSWIKYFEKLCVCRNIRRWGYESLSIILMISHPGLTLDPSRRKICHQTRTKAESITLWLSLNFSHFQSLLTLCWCNI